jgi:hypothetical protein
MLEMAIVETQRQPTGIVITQSFDVGKITTRVEIVVVPIMDVVKRGVLIGFIAKLDNGLHGVSIKKIIEWEYGISNNNY